VAAPLDAFVSCLWACEDKLLAEGPQDIEPSPRLALAAELETSSPLALVVPQLENLQSMSLTSDCGKHHISEPTSGSQSQFTVTREPTAESDSALNGQVCDDSPEEERLQRMIGQLAEQKDELVKSVREAREQRRQQKAIEAAVNRDQTREGNEQEWAEVAALRRELLTVYGRLQPLCGQHLDLELIELRSRFAEAEMERQKLQQLRKEPSHRRLPGSKWEDCSELRRVDCKAGSRTPLPSCSLTARERSLTPLADRSLTSPKQQAPMLRVGASPLRQRSVTPMRKQTRSTQLWMTPRC